jgi:hypothetical protein
MLALHFNDAQGAREFISTIEDEPQALKVAGMLSRQDARDVVVIENRTLGDTIVRAIFRRGLNIDEPASARRQVPEKCL